MEAFNKMIAAKWKMRVMRKGRILMLVMLEPSQEIHRYQP